MKKTLYHGTITDFDYFDEKFLGNNIQDLLSFLGFHFTENKKLAENLFARDYYDKKKGYIITVEINETENNTIEIGEKDLVMDILTYGLEHNLVTKYYYNKIKKLPYRDSFGGDCIIRSLYNNGKRTNSKNYIDKKELSLKYKEYLLLKGIEIIKYKNEIERTDENRFDYIILNLELIKIIKKEKM